MIVPKYLRTRADGVDLMETTSTLNLKLKQVETGEIYGASVIDVILGYNDGVPYGAYTYEEADERETPSEEDAEYIQAAKIMLGEIKPL